MLLKVPFVVLAWTAALLCLAQANAAAPNKALSGLDAYVEQVRADWENVGVAVAVVQGTEVIYARGLGVKQLGKPDRIDADTLFQIGSTTKAFTAAAVAMLVEEGKLRWDDPVIDHLPGFRLQDPWLTRNLTLRDAVAHRSGIAGTAYFALAVMDSEQAVGQLGYARSDAPFRDSFRYNNLMYGVAGKVVEKVSGMTWNEFVKRRLLQPLKMKRSGTTAYEFWDAKYVTGTFFGVAPAGPADLSQARDRNVAMPHWRNLDGQWLRLPWQNYDNAAAAGTIVSSVADMANWIILNLNEGRFEGRQLLKTETVQELHAMQNLHGLEDAFPFDDEPGYALGWRRATYRGRVHLEHGGGIIGFPAYVALMPENKIGVVVLTNGPYSFSIHHAIAFWTFDRLLGAPVRDWRKEYMAVDRAAQQKARDAEESLRQARLPNAPPSLALEQYAGVYEDHERQSGPVYVRLENGGLKLSFPGEGAYQAKLEHWHHETFRLRSVAGPGVWLEENYPPFTQFTLDASGKVVSMSAFNGTLRRVPAGTGTDAAAQ